VKLKAYKGRRKIPIDKTVVDDLEPFIGQPNSELGGFEIKVNAWKSKKSTCTSNLVHTCVMRDFSERGTLKRGLARKR